MKAGLLAALAAFLISGVGLSAELPPLLKPTAENYDRAMKSYDDVVAARVKQARDSYVVVLGATRKRSEGAKRADEVAAIDLEITGVNAGSLAGEPPAHFPKELARYRADHVHSAERAAQAVASSRRFTRNQYLKWLDGMAVNAEKGKDAVIEAAVDEERKRVVASAPDAQ